ncbi:MAG: T9SS type A sorting domain-containing protein [Candidatus Delongbacteria bacterium]|jgi:hypothetical protein|nr:T9SS type A sorting domain-containing protein [Candidatus Delongbacteria bacterium]
MKNPKLLPILLVLLLAKTITYAQPESFYHEFPVQFNDSVEMAFQQNSFQISDSTYLSTGNRGINFYGLAGRVIWDSAGNVLDAKYLDVDESFYLNGLTRIDSNRFLLYGQFDLYHDSTGSLIDHTAAMVCFNKNGDVIWQKAYGGYAPGFPDIEAPWYDYDDSFLDVKIDSLNERIYAIGGSNAFNVEHEYKPYVVCTNYNGDTIWTWTMPDMPNHNGGSISGATITTESDLMLVGQMPRHGPGKASYTKGLVLKLSGEGNMEWYKLWGDDWIPNTYDIVETNENEYVFGGIYTVTEPDTLLYGVDVGVLKKIDDSGNFLSEKHITRDTNDIIRIYKMIKKEYGFAVIGSFRINDIDNFYVNKYTNDLNIISEKNYVIENNPYGTFGIRGISETYDGGYLYTGYGGDQTNMVMKSDGEFNFPLSEGWQAIYVPNTKTEIRFYPNPATKILYVKSTGNKPLEDIKIYDMYGRIVMEQYCDNAYCQINVGHIKSGLYVLRVNKLYSGKLIIK